MENEVAMSDLDTMREYAADHKKCPICDKELTDIGECPDGCWGPWIYGRSEESGGGSGALS